MGSEILGEQNGCDKASLPPLTVEGLLRLPLGLQVGEQVPETSSRTSSLSATQLSWDGEGAGIFPRATITTPISLRVTSE